MDNPEVANRNQCIIIVARKFSFEVNKNDFTNVFINEILWFIAVLNFRMFPSDYLRKNQRIYKIFQLLHVCVCVHCACAAAAALDGQLAALAHIHFDLAMHSFSANKSEIVIAGTAPLHFWLAFARIPIPIWWYDRPTNQPTNVHKVWGDWTTSNIGRWICSLLRCGWSLYNNPELFS